MQGSNINNRGPKIVKSATETLYNFLNKDFSFLEKTTFGFILTITTALLLSYTSARFGIKMAIGNEFNTTQDSNTAQQKLKLIQAGDYLAFKDLKVWSLYKEDIEKLQLEEGAVFLGYVRVDDSGTVSEDAKRELIQTAYIRHSLNENKTEVRIEPVKPIGEWIGNGDSSVSFVGGFVNENDLVIYAIPKQSPEINPQS